MGDVILTIRIMGAIATQIISVFFSNRRIDVTTKNGKCGRVGGAQSSFSNPSHDHRMFEESEPRVCIRARKSPRRCHVFEPFAKPDDTPKVFCVAITAIKHSSAHVVGHSGDGDDAKLVKLWGSVWRSCGTPS